MMICIPTVDEGGLLSRVSTHLGKTSYFTFIKLEHGKIKEINAIGSTGRQNGSSRTPTELILNSKVDMLICGSLGTKAISTLHSNGIKVISGASGKVKDVFNEWKVGTLPRGNLCKNCKSY